MIIRFENWIVISVLTIVSINITLAGHAQKKETVKSAILSLANCKKCLLLTDLSEHRVVIADVAQQAIIWEWKPAQSNINAKDLKWFINYSDVKPVYNNKYLLLSSSAGGVALVRIEDKKAVFYAYAGGNTHSIELLPDGNIVAASSTGNKLTIFRVDTLNFHDTIIKKSIPLPFAHNVVWDKKQQILFAAGKNKLYTFRYNFKCDHPDLIVIDSTILPGTNAHDLFPVYGQSALWLSMMKGVYKVDVQTKKLTPVDASLTNNIKSISSGPKGFPTIVMQPKEQWWSNEVKDFEGNTIFKKEGMRIYKARWFLPNTFSYPLNSLMHICVASKS